MRRVFATLLALLLNFQALTAQASLSAYSKGVTRDDAFYGATVGAGVQWKPAYIPAAQASAEAGFGGNVSLSCSGIDFQGFLKQFNPKELLHDMKNTLMSGAQAAVSSYLITLAYSNPTIASVLDMLDKKYTARFDAFAQACNAQEAKKRGQDIATQRLAEASEQCFSAQILQGASPTEAYRSCADVGKFGSMDLPALKNTDEFLKRYTSVDVTKEIGALLKLLPDEQITGTGLKMKPPQATTMQMFSNVEARARNALTAVLAGEDPSTIPDCKEQDLIKAPSGSEKCIPSTAANLVNSPAFMAARLLSPPAAELYTSAMSSQIATAAMYANIYELKQQVSQIDAKDNSGVTATEVLRRRETLLKSIDRLEQEADILKKIHDSKARLAKTQILTLQKAEDELAALADQANASAGEESTGFRRLLRVFY